jgi:hypothetical protein
VLERERAMYGRLRGVGSPPVPLLVREPEPARHRGLRAGAGGREPEKPRQADSLVAFTPSRRAWRRMRQGGSRSAPVRRGAPSA